MIGFIQTKNSENYFSLSYKKEYSSQILLIIMRIIHFTKNKIPTFSMKMWESGIDFYLNESIY